MTSPEDSLAQHALCLLNRGELKRGGEEGVRVHLEATLRLRYEREIRHP